MLDFLRKYIYNLVKDPKNIEVYTQKRSGLYGFQIH